MLPSQYPGVTSGLQARSVAIENLTACFVMGNLEMTRVDGQVGARGKTHEIDSVRHQSDFIEVVNAPYQARFGVAPGAEVFHVKVADGKNLGSLFTVGALFMPELAPGAT